MKKKFIFIFSAFVLIINISFAQNKIEKYCKITVDARRVSIDFGNPNTFFRDSSVKKSLLAISSFKNEVDVLDYMNRQGWTLVSIVPWGQFNVGRTFYFKKEFDRSELTIDSN